VVIKIREGGTVQRRALYLALGVTLDGDRDVLGMWFQESEGAKFWMQVLTDLKTRGVRDILICCVDGLTASSARGRTAAGRTEDVEDTWEDAGSERDRARRRAQLRGHPGVRGGWTGQR
jgi:hypothetical protein